MKKVFIALSYVLCWGILVFSDIPQVEREALIALYNATDGDNWTCNDGWLGAPGTECSWYGVTCDTEENYVSQLNLMDSQKLNKQYNILK